MGETGATDLMVMGRPYGGGNILGAVVQEILLYGLETWVLLE